MVHVISGKKLGLTVQIHSSFLTISKASYTLNTNDNILTETNT